ncbi:MAG: restriction endonuclease subunit S [Segatella copri]|uniref:Restriction endonuclease subunit S n=2 Tax=Segatella copri TaxID=165179 RepID=A0AA92W4X6_9BACT|nr:restriction endonuclease subunit S [Segatella copri]RGV01720.1 restriction endonuclease subunit S [Segatella copri]
MERYSERMETKLFWQSSMPKHWHMIKLKYVLKKLQRSKMPNAELLICSNSGRVTKRGDNKLGLVADDDKIYQGVGKGDLLIHGMDTWHGAIAISEYDGMCTPVVHVCESNQNKSFIAYYLRNMAYEKVFKLISNGVRQNTSDFRCWDKLAAIPIILPPLTEQQAIVSYLDIKCSKLDTLVENKEKEISLLSEMKQRIIADAVTRGLNPNVKFKATNIPWLPEIPEHWKLLRNKSFMKQTDEKVGKQQNVTLLSLTKQGVIVRDLSEGKGKFPKDFESYIIVKPKNLVFCLFDIDETPRTVGLVRNNGMLTGAYSNFQIDEEVVEPEFTYYYYLQVDDVKGLKPFYTGLRKVVKINTFSQLRIPIPPLSEQQAIVSYITERTAKIDSLIEKLNKEIECIKEYKQRLISDVVTGQIKVS